MFFLNGFLASLARIISTASQGRSRRWASSVSPLTTTTTLSPLRVENRSSDPFRFSDFLPSRKRFTSLSPQGFRNLHSRSEEHTSELQSLRHLECRLLLEKKKQTHN